MIAAAQQRVFRALDPYAAPFSDRVPARALARAAGSGFFRIHYEFQGESEFIRDRFSWSTPGGVAARDQWRVFLELWHMYGRDRARQMLTRFPEIR